MTRIQISPLGDGWRVSADGLANDLVFKGGASAEAAARRLAQRLNTAGRAAELRFILRDGSEAPRQILLPSEASGRMAEAA